ncbi:MAG: hypothetical protein ABR981_01480 [Candidatus Micrarchaeaceae archaeon]|jgi:hypothetical protein
MAIQTKPKVPIDTQRVGNIIDDWARKTGNGNLLVLGVLSAARLNNYLYELEHVKKQIVKGDLNKRDIKNALKIGIIRIGMIQSDHIHQLSLSGENELVIYLPILRYSEELNSYFGITPQELREVLIDGVVGILRFGDARSAQIIATVANLSNEELGAGLKRAESDKTIKLRSE